MEAKNTSKQGWKAVQGKELRGKYDETKFTKLITSRRDAGLFYEDPDFPGDVDETCLAPGVCKLGVSLGVRYVQENQSLGWENGMYPKKFFGYGTHGVGKGHGYGTIESWDMPLLTTATQRFGNSEDTLLQATTLCR